MPCFRVSWTRLPRWLVLAVLVVPLAARAAAVFPGLLAIDQVDAATAEAPLLEVKAHSFAQAAGRDTRSMHVATGDGDFGMRVTTPLFAVAFVFMLIVFGVARQPLFSTDKADGDDSAAPSSADSREQPGWGTVLLCFCCCSLAAGIVPGQTIFVKLFAQAGAFKSLCSGGFAGPVCDEQYFRMAELLNTVSLAVLVPTIAFGVAFDRWGARTCGMLGSVWVAFSFVAVAVIVALISAFPEANLPLSYSLIVAILSADLGGFMCDYAMLGFLWHFSSYQTVIIALWNVTYNSGAFFALGMEWVMVRFSVPLVYPLVWWAVTQSFVTLVLYRVVPSHSEFHAKAKEVLGVKLPDPPASFELMQQVQASWRVLMQDASKHLFMGLLMMTGTAYGMFYLSMAVPIGDVLFGTDGSGARLGNYCTVAVGVVGCLAGLLVSICADSYGFGVLIVTYMLSLLLFTLTFWIPSWGAAAVACGSNAAFSMLLWVMSSRWFVHFAAPARLGTVIGTFYFLTYLFSIVETWVSLEGSESMEPGLHRFLLPLGVCGAAAVLAGSAFSLLFWLQPAFPKNLRLVAEDEKDLAGVWGCSSFQEVGSRLGIDDQAEVVRRLCSTDPSEIRVLHEMLGSQ